MDYLDRRIMATLRKARKPMKAREIAVVLDATRKRVNQRLYGSLQQLVDKNGAHAWSIREDLRPKGVRRAKRNVVPRRRPRAATAREATPLVTADGAVAEALVDAPADLLDFLNEEVLPLLFENLNDAFPEFGWKRYPQGWRGLFEEKRVTCRKRQKDRFMSVSCATNRIEMTWLEYVNQEQWPVGPAFVRAVAGLMAKAGGAALFANRLREKLSVVLPDGFDPSGVERLFQALRTTSPERARRTE